MNCPRHEFELSPQIVHDHQIDQCPECGGLWIQGASVDQLLGPGEKLKLRSLCSFKKSELRCPSDSHQLFEGKIGPVTVDLCQRCNSLWLDSGELETLLQRRPLTPHVSTEPSVDHLNPVPASSDALIFALTLLATGLGPGS